MGHVNQKSVLKCDFLEENTRDKYFKTDSDKYNSAEYARFTRQTRTEFASDEKPCRAYGKGYNCYYCRRNERFNKGVAFNCKADGKSVDRGCHSLNEQSTEGELSAAAVFFLAADAFSNKADADIKKQGKGYPRNEFLKGFKQFY